MLRENGAIKKLEGTLRSKVAYEEKIDRIETSVQWLGFHSLMFLK